MACSWPRCLAVGHRRVENARNEGKGLSLSRRRPPPNGSEGGGHARAVLQPRFSLCLARRSANRIRRSRSNQHTAAVNGRRLEGRAGAKVPSFAWRQRNAPKGKASHQWLAAFRAKGHGAARDATAGLGIGNLERRHVHHHPDAGSSNSIEGDRPDRRGSLDGWMAAARAAA